MRRYLHVWTLPRRLCLHALCSHNQVACTKIHTSFLPSKAAFSLRLPPGLRRDKHHAVSTGETKAYSVLKQKASRIALDLWRFTGTLVNRTERSSFENMAVNLAARISAMDRVNGQAEKRRLSLVSLSQRLLQQLSRIQNPTFVLN